MNTALRFTYQDYLQLSEDRRYEIVDGDLYMVPAWIQLVSATRALRGFPEGGSRFHGGFTGQVANGLSSVAYFLLAIFRQPKTLKNNPLFLF